MNIAYDRFEIYNKDSMHLEENNLPKEAIKIEDLNKTQLLFLGILVSFVTSIATGIITVTLMDQAPPGVTQTINRVVEKTVQVVAPEMSQNASVIETIVIKEEDFIADAAERNTSRMVHIGGFVDEDDITFVATGFVVSDDGYVVADASVLPRGFEQFVVKTVSDRVLQAEIVDHDHEDLTFLKITDEAFEETVFDPLVFATAESVRIGQTAIVLGLDDGVALSRGTISRLSTEEGVLTTVYATVDTSDHYSGGPLLNTNGDVVGISLVADMGSYSALPFGEITSTLRSIKDDSEEADITE